ncbi:MAG TPA: response regulator transcription factor [bacterium]|jgi:two-component system response regulator DegU|nr:response regulator transcription factor [bacterium]
MTKIRVLIVDDHPVVRTGIKKVVELEDDILIVAEAGTAEAAMKQVVLIEPDVVLMDLDLPDKSGIEITAEIKDQFPDIGVVALTVHDDRDHLLKMVQAGAAGYVLKDVEPGELVGAIRAVNEGNSYMSPPAAKKLMGEFTRMANGREEKKLDGLTAREEEVLLLLADGRSNKQIGAALDISEKTVKNHVTSIFRKIKVGDRTEAALYAIRKGLVELN